MSSSNDTLVGWVQNSGGRGTWSLLWSCLTTLGLSIFVCYHPKINDPRLSDYKWMESKWVPNFIKRMSVVEFIASFVRTAPFLWAPELLVVFAFGELLNARSFRRAMRRRGYTDFTLREAYFATMGGYRISIPMSSQQSDTGKPRRAYCVLSIRRILWLLDSGILGLQSVKMASESTRHQKDIPEEPTKLFNVAGKNADDAITPTLSTAAPATAAVPMTATTVTAKVAPLTPPPQAYLTSFEVIGSRSHSDGIAKLVVICQASIFVVNCIGRGAHNLPLSLLEIATLSYIVTTFGAYIFWWSKPQNVKEATTFVLDLSDAQWEKLHLNLDENNYPRPGDWEEDEYDLSSNDTANEDKPSVNSGLWASLSLVPLWWLSTGINFAAWNSIFPSHVEQILWRIFISFLMSIPLLVLGLSPLFFSKRPSVVRLVKLRAIIGAIGLYTFAIAKLGSLVLPFISLRAAPAAIYDTWEISNWLLFWL